MTEMASYIKPGQHDVLMGRGKATTQHPGNVQFRRFVDIYREEYRAAGRTGKQYIVSKAVYRL